MNTDTSPFMLGNFLLWIQVAILANAQELEKIDSANTDIDDVVDRILANKLKERIHEDHFSVVKAIVAILIKNNSAIRDYPNALPQDIRQLDLFPELAK